MIDDNVDMESLVEAGHEIIRYVAGKMENGINVIHAIDTVPENLTHLINMISLAVYEQEGVEVVYQGAPTTFWLITPLLELEVGKRVAETTKRDAMHRQKPPGSGGEAVYDVFTPFEEPLPTRFGEERMMEVVRSRGRRYIAQRLEGEKIYIYFYYGPGGSKYVSFVSGLLDDRSSTHLIISPVKPPASSHVSTTPPNALRRMVAKAISRVRGTPLPLLLQLPPTYMVYRDIDPETYLSAIDPPPPAFSSPIEPVEKPVIPKALSHVAELYTTLFTKNYEEGRRTPVALITGLPGAGKTTVAQGILRMLGYPNAFRLALHNVMAKYVGETEKNLRMALGEAEESDAPLVIEGLEMFTSNPATETVSTINMQSILMEAVMREDRTFPLIFILNIRRGDEEVETRVRRMLTDRSISDLTIYVPPPTQEEREVLVRIGIESVGATIPDTLSFRISEYASRLAGLGAGEVVRMGRMIGTVWLTSTDPDRDALRICRVDYRDVVAKIQMLKKLYRHDAPREVYNAVKRVEKEVEENIRLMTGETHEEYSY